MSEIVVVAVRALPGVCFLLSFALLVWIASQEGFSKDSRAFAWVLAAVLGWQATDFLLNIPAAQAHHLKILRLAPLFYMGAPLLFLNFAHELASRRRDTLYIAVQVLGWAVAFTSLATDWNIAGVHPSVWGSIYEPGPWHLPLMFTGILLPAGLGAWRLLQAVRSSYDILQVHRVRGVLLGLAAATVLGLLNNVVLLHWMQTDFPLLGSSIVTVFCMFAFFSLVRFRLFTVSLADVAEGLFARSAQGAVLIDHQRRIVAVNPAGRSLLGSLAQSGTSIYECFRFPQYEFDEEFEDREYTHFGEECVQQWSLTQETVLRNGVPSGRLLLFSAKAGKLPGEFLATTAVRDSDWMVDFIDGMRAAMENPQSIAVQMPWAQRWLNLRREGERPMVEPFALSSVLGSLCRRFGPSLAHKGMEWKLEQHEDVPDLLIGDAGRLEELLGALLHFSVQRADLGWVVLAVRPRERTDYRVELVFSISDTGLAGALLPMVAGACRELCSVLGGELGEEALDGYGNTLWCRLPFGLREVSQIKGSVPRLLLVESEDESLRLPLSSEEFQCIRVQGSTRVLDALGRGRFQLVVVDMTLPDVYFCIAEMRRFLGGRWIPVLGIGEGREVIRNTQEERGPDLCISKGLREDSLLQAIYGLLGRTAPIRSDY